VIANTRATGANSTEMIRAMRPNSNAFINTTVEISPFQSLTRILANKRRKLV
jgi:hypothetical protein